MRKSGELLLFLALSFYIFQSVRSLSFPVHEMVSNLVAIFLRCPFCSCYVVIIHLKKIDGTVISQVFDSLDHQLISNCYSVLRFM